jgi:hypothetical protein
MKTAADLKAERQALKLKLPNQGRALAGTVESCIVEMRKLADSGELSQTQFAIWRQLLRRIVDEVL